MPLNLTNEQRTMFETIFHAPTIQNIRRIAIPDFKWFVAYLFEREGKFDPLVIDGPGDGDVDIQLRLPFGNPPIIVGLVQCKRYLNDPVREPAIREFKASLGVVPHGFYFTASRFTPAARNNAFRPPEIYLYDAEQIAKWIFAIKLQNPPIILPVPVHHTIPIICIANHKGGVGKTAITCCLATGMAHLGMHVMVIDTDPQCNLTHWLAPRRLEFSAERSLKVVFERDHPLQPLIETNTTIPRVSLIPGHGDMPLEMPFDKEMRLAHQLGKLPVDELNIDAIIIDTQPARSSLTRAALIASQSLLIPFRLDEPSFIGIQQFLPFLANTEANFQIPPLDILGGVEIAVEGTILQTKIRDKLNEALIKTERVQRSRYPTKADFWAGSLRKRTDYQEAEEGQRSILREIRSDAATDVLKLTTEVLQRVNAYAHVAN